MGEVINGANQAVLSVEGTVGDLDLISSDASVGIVGDPIAETVDLSVIGFGSAPNASVTVKGVTKLSDAPAAPTNPIALGKNASAITPVNGLSVTVPATAAVGSKFQVVEDRAAAAGNRIAEFGYSVAQTVDGAQYLRVYQGTHSVILASRAAGFDNVSLCEVFSVYRNSAGGDGMTLTGNMILSGTLTIGDGLTSVIQGIGNDIEIKTGATPGVQVIVESDQPSDPTSKCFVARMNVAQAEGSTYSWAGFENGGSEVFGAWRAFGGDALVITSTTLMGSSVIYDPAMVALISEVQFAAGGTNIQGLGITVNYDSTIADGATAKGHIFNVSTGLAAAGALI